MTIKTFEENLLHIQEYLLCPDLQNTLGKIKSSWAVKHNLLQTYEQVRRLNNYLQNKSEASLLRGSIFVALCHQKDYGKDLVLTDGRTKIRFHIKESNIKGLTRDLSRVIRGEMELYDLTYLG